MSGGLPLRVAATISALAGASLLPPLGLALADGDAAVSRAFALPLAAAPSRVPALCQTPSVSYMTRASRLLPAGSVQRSRRRSSPFLFWLRPSIFSYTRVKSANSASQETGPSAAPRLPSRRQRRPSAQSMLRPPSQKAKPRAWEASSRCQTR